ncbi:MAG: RNA polymerase sigma factor [Clostridium sp.]
MEHSLYDVDKEARFQKVYDSYMQDVYRLCFSYMKNKMDTEDAVQETFCRFYQAMERVKEKEHVKGWLLVTAGNVSQRKYFVKHWCCWKNRSWQEKYE